MVKDLKEKEQKIKWNIHRKDKKQVQIRETIDKKERLEYQKIMR